ncbi:MAG: FG-GAP repeat protein, partial [Phycisphaerae bacterium]
MFERDTNRAWPQVAKLSADDGASWDGFGRSVALDADIAVIGAPTDDDPSDNAGSAYVFDRNADGAWDQVGKFTIGNAAPSDLLGSSVAISGNTAIVGACQDDDHGTDSGSAYVFAVGPDEDGDGIMDACLC